MTATSSLATHAAVKLVVFASYCGLAEVGTVLSIKQVSECILTASCSTFTQSLEVWERSACMTGELFIAA